MVVIAIEAVVVVVVVVVERKRATLNQLLKSSLSRPMLPMGPWLAVVVVAQWVPHIIAITLYVER